MDLDFKTEYFFRATSEPEYRYLYDLEYIGTFSNKLTEGKELPELIERLRGYPALCFGYHDYTLKGVIKPNELIEDVLEVHLHLNGDILLGYDLASGNAIQCKLYGQKNKDGISDFNFMGIQVRPIKFDTVNIFNCPSPEYAEYWHEAVKAKMHDDLYTIFKKPDALIN